MLQASSGNAAFAESIEGWITAGKLADFVVLADDRHTVAKDKIKNIQLVQTVVGGSHLQEVR